MTKIKLHIDSSGYHSKPKGEIIAKIKSGLQSYKNIQEIELRGIKFFIERGYSISPAVMKQGCTASNWSEQRLFMVDIDNNRENVPILSLKEALNICKEANLMPALYYYSYSHTDEKPKFRLCFITDEVITDTNIRAIIVETLISLFNQSDTSAKNADRIFFGTNKECVILDESARITINDILMIHEPTTDKISQIETNSQFNDVKTYKNSFDLFNFLKERNGEPIINNSKYAMFERCELCGHKRDLVYYHKTNTFMCFSSDCHKGGSIIDYLMALNNFTLKEAINYFLYEMLKLPKNESNIKLISNEEILKQLELLEVERKYTFDDKGISKLFSNIYKDSVRFNVTANEWYYYNGKVWLEDTKGMIVSQKAEELSDNLLIYATKINDEDIKCKFLKYVAKLGQLKYRETLIRDSKNIYFISQSDFDKNDELFNCQNGTFNLKTFEFRKHNPEDLLSRISNVFYDPLAETKRFKLFVNEVLEDNLEIIKFIQIILGYSLTAETSLEACFIFFGNSTRNGKTTFIETISYMLGNDKGYAMNSTPETIALKLNKDSRSASGDIARLNNCRFLSISELPKNLLLDNALLKSITGRDKLTARHLLQKEFEFYPKFKLFINCNHLPLITDDTLFNSNRINIIPFNRHFTPQEQDIYLKEKLKSTDEISGIFNWCIEGLKEYYKNGINISKPKAITEAIEKYKQVSDKIGLFIIDELEPAENENIKIKDAYEVYQKWCLNNGYRYENKTSFIDSIKKKNMFSDTATINKRTERNVINNYKLKKSYLINDLI